MSLEVRQLVKNFDGVEAVKGVSFDVQAGECVALIGPNGAGKSTCFACIAGQHHLTSGEVWWAGERVDAFTPGQRLSRGLTRTFQVAQTFEALTVLQNVQLLLQYPNGLAAFSSLNDALVDASLALLTRVGLADLAHADVLGLPYGAKKRLELAMALAGVSGALGSQPGPRLLLLDEPTVGLDIESRQFLLDHVRKLCAERGMAVLWATHLIDEADANAKVVVLHKGKILAAGSATGVIAASGETSLRGAFDKLVGSAPCGKGKP